ncbi:5244_t:CDS:2, partial [Acaulospora colombiana]
MRNTTRVVIDFALLTVIYLLLFLGVQSRKQLVAGSRRIYYNEQADAIIRSQDYVPPELSIQYWSLYKGPQVYVQKDVKATAVKGRLEALECSSQPPSDLFRKSLCPSSTHEHSTGIQEGNLDLELRCVQTQEEMRYRILRTWFPDAGGPGSISQLLMLKEFMARLAFDLGVDVEEVYPADHIDLMGGVGFGGLSALLLGRLRMHVDEAMDELAAIGNA